MNNENIKVVKSKDKKVIYYINKEKRTICCKKFVNEFENINFASSNLGIYAFDANFSFRKNLGMKTEYVAKACCHIDDKWDEEKGMKIALNKVLYKYYKDKVKAFKNLKKLTEELDYDMSKYLLRQVTNLKKKENFLKNIE